MWYLHTCVLGLVVINRAMDGAITYDCADDRTIGNTLLATDFDRMITHDQQDMPCDSMRWPAMFRLVCSKSITKLWKICVQLLSLTAASGF